MIIDPIQQLKLIGFNNNLFEFVNMHKRNILPNKILLTGKKGIGKSTFAYHFINYLFSYKEEFSYNMNEMLINQYNRSYKLLLNNTHPNFFKVSLNSEKKSIDINQIREMILFINKSTFDNNKKIILIDDVEYLNINAANSLLKSLEEPSENTYFILIHNSSKKIIETIKSRCIEFKFFLNSSDVRTVVNNYFNDEIYDQLSNDFKYNLTSSFDFINLINLLNKYKLEIPSINVEFFLKYVISNNLFKKEEFLKNNFKVFMEIFFKKKILLLKDMNIYNLYNYFNKKNYFVKKFNLDTESYLIEFNNKALNE